MKDDHNLDSKLNRLKMRKFIIVGGILLLFLISGASIFLYLNTGERKVSIGNKLASNKIYDGLKITNIKANRAGKEFHIKFSAENNSDIDYYSEKEGVINFLDEEGKTVKKIDVLIPSVPAHQEANFDIVLDKKILRSYDFNISDK